jgi:hypothetical protein
MLRISHSSSINPPNPSQSSQIKDRLAVLVHVPYRVRYGTTLIFIYHAILILFPTIGLESARIQNSSNEGYFRGAGSPYPSSPQCASQHRFVSCHLHAWETISPSVSRSRKSLSRQAFIDMYSIPGIRPSFRTVQSTLLFVDLMEFWRVGYPRGTSATMFYVYLVEGGGGIRQYSWWL